MKFNRILGSISTTLLMIFVLNSCSIVQKTEDAIRGEVLATYSERKITRGEVEDYYKGFEDALKGRYGEDYKSNKEYINQQLKAFAENYAQNAIFIEEFSNREIATEEEINKEVDNIISETKHLFIDDENGTLDDGHGHKINEEKLNKELKAAYYTDIEDYRAKQIDRLKIDKLVNDVIKDVSVNEEEIKDYYEENKDSKYVTKSGAVMYHILVSTEEEALKVKERIQSGEKYEDLAAELNSDSTSQTGGSLGFVEYDNTNYDPDFLAGARNLKEGEISDPIKTQFGYHVIKVTDIKEESVYDDFDSVKSNIEQTILNEKKQKLVSEFSDNLFKEKNLKIN